MRYEPDSDLSFECAHNTGICCCGMSLGVWTFSKYFSRSLLGFSLVFFLEQGLMPHQLDGIGRVLRLEKVHRAAVLGDQMGLGKTIQALAVVVEGKQRGVGGTTLVLVPPAVLHQWEDTIRRKVVADTINFLVYYGEGRLDPETGRSWLPQQMKEFDIILTTYRQVRNEFGAHETYLLGMRRTVTVPVGEIEAETENPTYGWTGAGEATRVLIAEQGFIEITKGTVC